MKLQRMELGPDGELKDFAEGEISDELPEKRKTGLIPRSVVSRKAMVSFAGRLKKAAIKVLILLVVLVLLAAVCAGLVFVVHKIQEPGRLQAEFANQFMSSQSIEEGTFYIGEEGNPALFEVPEQIPWGRQTGLVSGSWHVERVAVGPEKYQIRNCQFFVLRPEASEIYVITEFQDPTRITVSMPQGNSGAVNICTSLSHIVEVALWSN